MDYLVFHVENVGAAVTFFFALGFQNVARVATWNLLIWRDTFALTPSLTVGRTGALATVFDCSWLLLDFLFVVSCFRSIRGLNNVNFAHLEVQLRWPIFNDHFALA